MAVSQGRGRINMQFARRDSGLLPQVVREGSVPATLLVDHQEERP
jgi:hypothetical protein